MAASWTARSVPSASLTRLQKEISVGQKELSGAQHGSNAFVDPQKNKRERDAKGVWHAQAGQDRTIAKLFSHKRDGYFIDLASNEPIFLSNTRSLERDFGWKGLCIDGSLDLAIKALERRTCQPVQAIVESFWRYRPLHASKGAHKSASDELRDSGYGGIVGLTAHGKENWLVEEHTTSTLAELSIITAPKTSLDVDDAVFLNFPFEQYTFLTINSASPCKAGCRPLSSYDG